MRVLILSELNPAKLGSMEEFAIFLAGELCRRGHVGYFSFTAEPVPQVRAMLEGAGGRVADDLISLCSVVGRGMTDKLKRALQLRHFIAENRIDLVQIIFYSLTNPLLTGVYLSGAKIVFNEQTSVGVPRRGVLKQVVSRLIHGFLTGRITKYVAISEFVRTRMEISHHVFAPQSLTIYNAVNLARFVPQDRDDARKRLGIAPEKKIVLTVANLIPEKGLQFLIEAVATVVTEYGMGDALLMVAGEGGYQRELESLVAHYGLGAHVTFLGLRSNVDEFVAAADLVAVPSIWPEAFGYIVAEAMAGGRVVIASRIGGIPELVSDGESGLLVAPGDSRALADGIAKLLAEPDYSRQLAENALHKCHRLFNLRDKVVEYVDLYEGVVR